MKMIKKDAKCDFHTQARGEAGVPGRPAVRADRLLTWCLSARQPGIDGILVTVGLCIIALLLCVVMKDSLANFIETIVTSLTDKAAGILSGVK